jgi:homocitrate synthase NifV
MGKNIFFHEAGVQAHGVLKEPGTYEVFSPQEVGGERQILIGKHSGRSSLKAKFHEYGVVLADEEAEKVLKEVRKEAIALKRHLFDKELMHIYYRVVKGFDKL